ncbi:MAG: hypothetical protein AAGG48_29995 [Planctomycetota bacterium]
MDKHRMLVFPALLLVCLYSLGQENTTETVSTIEIGTPWPEAKALLKRHSVFEDKAYPDYGFDPGKPIDFSERQYRIEEGVRLWFTRDDRQKISSIELHVYYREPESKLALRALSLRSLKLHKDGSYDVRVVSDRLKDARGK